MKTLTLQILGLVFNLFLVFIIISYSNLNKFISRAEGDYEKLNNVSPILTNGMARNTLTLKRISILLIQSYIIFNINFLGEINTDLQVQDGKIKITETSILKTSFLFIVSILILFNQSNINKVNDKGGKTEKYIILLTNIQGITFLINSNDWVLTIISWEVFNMSLYLLVSLKSESEAGLSASLKYFLLSALSTTFLLLGVCIQYYITGSTNYEIINTVVIEQKRSGENRYIEIASSQVLFTILFKLSAAPFYQWAPDLYENIETKITMWMIIMPKLAVLCFLYSLSSFFSLFLELSSVQLILISSATLSLFIGCVALNNQWYIKRFFAYSGISHVGFMLFALACLAPQGFIFYMFIYGITTINIFTIIIILSEYTGRDVKMIQDLAGIFRHHPFLSLALALNLFSLAGVCLSLYSTDSQNRTEQNFSSL